jgi:hypothetical protein
LISAQAHEERADDRRDDARRADRQRIDHQRPDDRLPRKVDRSQNHRGHDRDCVGLEQIGCHAGAIADVVTDVICNGRGVSRIVLGNSRLDLAHEIATDVSTLGKDTAAETGEDGNQGGPETERHEGVDHRPGGWRVTQPTRQEREIDGDSEKCEAGNQQAGDGASAKGHGQPFGERLRGGLRRPHVCAHGHEHADETGHARQDCPDQEADSDEPAQQRADDQENDDAHDGNRRVLTRQVRRGALLNRGCDFLHARGACVGSHHGSDGPCPVDDRQQPAQDDRPHNGIHGVFPPVARARTALNTRKTAGDRWIAASKLDSRGTMPKLRRQGNTGVATLGQVSRLFACTLA